MGVSFCCLGHAPGMGLGGGGGGGGGGEGSWGGDKRSNIIKFQFHRIFKPNFVGLLTNERYKFHSQFKDFQTKLFGSSHKWKI